MSKQSILIFGLHAVQSLFDKHPERILKLMILRDREDSKMQWLLDAAKRYSIKIDYASRHELDRIAHQENHQGVIAFCQPAKRYIDADLTHLIDQLAEPALLLILDSVQDPHNLGACLRTADAAGVHAVIAPVDKSVGLTSIVSKVACGAAETVPFIQVTNLVRTLESLKERNIWLYGAASEAEQSLYQTDLTGSSAIILGAEGKGMRRLTRDHCDFLLHIPMQGAISSLNVSVAAGVFLFETVRQRYRTSGYCLDKNK